MCIPAACFLLPLLLAACQSDSTSESTPAFTSPALGETMHFVCADDKTFDAAFVAGDSAHVQLEDRTVTLPHLLSGSGARYGIEDQIVVWFKGQRDAFIQMDGEMAYADCKRQ